MAAKDDLGRAGEDRASAHLVEHGYRLIARNWRCRTGELDIVAERDDLLVFVEVKTRRSEDYGHPFEAIDERKRRRLWALAHEWMRVHPDRARGRRVRLDAIGIVGVDPGSGALEHLRGLR